MCRKGRISRATIRGIRLIGLASDAGRTRATLPMWVGRRLARELRDERGMLRMLAMSTDRVARKTAFQALSAIVPRAPVSLIVSTRLRCRAPINYFEHNV